MAPDKRVECYLVLSYEEPDYSVGLNGGYYVVGLQIRGEEGTELTKENFVAIDREALRNNQVRYVFENDKLLDQECKAASEERWIDDDL